MTCRLVFNIATLAALGLLLNQRPTVPISVPEPPPTFLPLTIELRNAQALPGKTASISVDFVMKNNTNRVMTLVERWNSWGAYQWTYEVTDATGKKFTLGNPQMAWYANALTFFSIAPGSEFKLSSFLDYVQVTSHLRGNSFMCTENVWPSGGRMEQGKDGQWRILPPTNEGCWKYPVTIVGKFTAKIEQGWKIGTDKPKRSNWSGTITTAPITVKAPTIP